MAEPIWVDRALIDAIHLDQLQQHGGRPGLKDENALESALARARRKWAYELASDVATLAAAYGFGLATHHGSSDGNKRVAFMAVYTFLGLNGWELEAPEPEVVELMRAAAARRRSERGLAEWLRAHIVPRHGR